MPKINTLALLLLTPSLFNSAFAKGPGPIPSDMPSKVFHGKCQTVGGKKMGLLLIDNVAGKHHYSTHFENWRPEMDNGWNPYRYTSVKEMQRSSNGFHLQPEQELYPAKTYSYNKLRVDQPNSWHHIYVSYLEDGTLSVKGKKGKNPYSCELKENLEIPQTETEQGIPVSFGEHFCEFAYRCDDSAVEIMKEYHQVDSKSLEGIIGKPLSATCNLNNGRARSSFAAKIHMLVRIDRVKDQSNDFLTMTQKQVQGKNPFTNSTLEELNAEIDNLKDGARPILELDTFSIALNSYHKTWMRVTDKNLLLLGNWHGRQYTCKMAL